MVLGSSGLGTSGLGTCVIAIDAGTTGVRSRAVFLDGRSPISAYREFPQIFPQPGWVEHDPLAIWDAVVATLNAVTTEVLTQVERPHIAAIGITNQRETAVAWERTTGRPVTNAIVWQDRRTAERCDQLRNEGHLNTIRARTGLVLDPYFSASKWEWMLRSGAVDRNRAERGEITLGTVDSWIIARLTDGQVNATDVSNASRTMLCDIRTRQWDRELCELFGIPIAALPEICASSGRIGLTAHGVGIPGGIPISGVAGDQQAALFGQACWEPGMAKNTYGTGSFLLMNLGSQCPEPTDGLISTIAWELSDGQVAYALEGSIFVTGAAIQWIRDELGLIDHASQMEALAVSVPDSGGLVVVPAFTGLGSPIWDPYAQGLMIGISRGTKPGHIARATVEAIACQVADVAEAMAAHSGTALHELRVDGGASAMNLLLQIQADLLGVCVRRPQEAESTAMGAALLAGLAEGVWADVAALSDQWRLDAEFIPQPDEETAAQISTLRTRWHAAVGRSQNWLNSGS
jgi:glycerol kinase